VSSIINYTKKWDSVDSGCKSDSLKEIRMASRDLLEKVLYPTRRVEEWKYTNVTSLSKLDFQAASEFSIDKEARDAQSVDGFYNLVAVNGKLDASSLELANKISGLKVSTLAEYFSSNKDKAKEIFSSLESKYDTPFYQLNMSVLDEGFVFEVEKKAALDKPVKISFVSSGSSEVTSVQPRVIYLMNELSEATVVESYSSLKDSSHFMNLVTDISLAKGAVFNHTKIVTESSSSIHIGATRVNLERDALFNNMNGCLTGKMVRQDLNVILNGENSEANLNGIYVGKGQSHFDNHLNLFHRKPHARSSQTYKGVLDDESRGVFNGKVVIERYAQKTDASQVNKNLLLSDKAEVDTKPELWVDADDVKAAHGATVSQLDENEIFYFQTRGIDREKAESMLARGFVEEVVYMENNLAVRKIVDKELANSFPKSEK
jgi:Fe-S cluster assembly protein SufD